MTDLGVESPPVVSALLVVAALASHFIETYNVFLDPGMLRNVLHTDVKEATELWSPGLLLHLAWQAVLPTWLVWNVPLIAPCDTAQLRKCSTEQIVNTYDNTLLYTDHMLALTIRWLCSARASASTTVR